MLFSTPKFNTCHKPIDHCDPKQYCVSHECESFESSPSHKWVDTFLHSETGAVVDLFRHFHPNEEKKFTHWAVLTDARSGNYGKCVLYCFA